jgi:hypothetical protein
LKIDCAGGTVTIGTVSVQKAIVSSEDQLSVLEDIAASVAGGSTLPGTIVSLQKIVAVAGTAEALAATSAILTAVVRALDTNTGDIYVGDPSVDSTNGYVLTAGEAISIEIDDPAKLFLDVSVSGEGVVCLLISA